MFISKMSLPRRTFLRGVGATMALPLLEAMIPAATALAATPAAPVRRFVGVFSPNGMIMDAWTPEAAGTDFELKPVLKPLEAYKDQMVVVTNLSNGPQRAGGHALAPTMFLTGVMHPNRSEGADIRAGQSIDQALAEIYGKDTLFPSLELVAEDFTTEVGSCEIGFSCAYLNTISWKTATAPLPMEVSPRAVFDRMFGGTIGNAAERAARLKNRRSVLDAVSAEERYRLEPVEQATPEKIFERRWAETVMAVVLDRFSRKAIGWSLDRTLAARITVAALRQAIERRQPLPGVVIHSDQGVQYACADYNAVVQANHMTPSMSRPANPYDNAACESFMKTLKQEEIYCNQYKDFKELSAHLEEFIENYYNRLRLHSALGYRTPEEFERDAAAEAVSSGAPDAAVMKYFTPKEQEKPMSGSTDPIASNSATTISSP
jgi:hypothetical protein